MDRLLGVIGLTINLIFGTIATLGILKNNRLLNPIIIKKEDEQKSLQVETLQQIQLIRSAFATIEQNVKLEKNAKIAGSAVSLKSFGATSFFTMILFLFIGGNRHYKFFIITASPKWETRTCIGNKYNRCLL